MSSGLSDFLTDGGEGFRDLDPPEKMLEPEDLTTSFYVSGTDAETLRRKSGDLVSRDFLIESNIDSQKLDLILYQKSVRALFPWWANQQV